METLGYSCEEQELTRYDVWTSDEMFLTGTAAELIPVVDVDSRMIGDGKPGNLTARLLEAFHELVCRDGQMIQ